MNVELFLVSDTGDATSQGSFVVEPSKYHLAIRAARKELARSYVVRSINVKGDKSCLVAFVAERKPTPKKPKRKPIRHSGPIGKNRDIDKRGKKGQKR